MKLIAAVDSKWGIGKSGKLLFSVPEDMKFFREQTTGKTVVMGYNTLISLPGSKPLKNRTNIVLSKKPDLKIDGAYVCSSEKEMFELICSEENEIDINEVMIIGGASIYSMLMPYCSEALITKIYSDGGADCFIKDLDKTDGWEAIEASEEKDHEGLKFRFFKYKNNDIKPLSL